MTVRYAIQLVIVIWSLRADEDGRQHALRLLGILEAMNTALALIAAIGGLAAPRRRRPPRNGLHRQRFTGIYHWWHETPDGPERTAIH